MGYRKNCDVSKVIIFDWDDTICPSSFVDRWQIDRVTDLPAHVQRVFNEISKSAERCLHEASKCGEVLIITNSDDGWVKYSCERYLPRLLPAIGKYRIVSARTEYEKFYPGQPLCWKAAAFAHEVNELYAMASARVDENDELNTSYESCESLELTDVSSQDSRESSPVSHQKEVISFGDSMEERTAVRIVATQLSATPKSVMFVASPSPTQIVGQLHMLTQHMKFVCDHETSLDLEISAEQAQRCADQYMKRSKSAASDCPSAPPKIILRQSLSSDSGAFKKG